MNPALDFLKDETIFDDKMHAYHDQTIESDVAPLQQDKPCCPTICINSRILSSFSQITVSIAELHEVILKERHNNQTLQAQILDLKLREVTHVEKTMENEHANEPEHIPTKPFSNIKSKAKNVTNTIVVQENIYSEITEAITELRRQASNKSHSQGSNKSIINN